MQKFKKVKVIEVQSEAPKEEIVKGFEEPKKAVIAEFSSKFGREDLDKLVEKLNEIIRVINN